MNIFKRLSLAYKAFWLIPFDVQIKPFHVVGKIDPKYSIQCDNHYRTGCNHKQVEALYETRATFEVQETNSYFLCAVCSVLLEGAKYKLEYEGDIIGVPLDMSTGTIEYH